MFKMLEELNDNWDSWILRDPLLFFLEMKKTADSALVTDHATGAPPSPPSPFGLGQWLCARARETERENPTVQEEQG